MKANMIWVLMLCFGGTCLAQQHIVSGKVVDVTTKEPVIGAIVYLSPEGIQTITDLNGRYSIVTHSGLPDSIHIHLIGYEQYGIMIQKENQVQPELLHLLQPGVLNLEAIEISADPQLQATSIAEVDIHLRNTSTSQDILRMVPGLFIAQHAGGGKAEQIFLRGFDIDHGTDISITTDGMPVNMVSHAHGQGYADLHFLIPETVDRVHFGKGPYHTHHGNLATAGYVGFNTLNALPENTISFELGQFNTRRGLGMVNLLDRHEDRHHQNAWVAGELFSSDGYFDSPQDMKRYTLFGKFNTTIGASNYLMMSASAFSSDWSASGQIPQRAVDSGSIGYFGAIDDTEEGKTSRSNLNVMLSTVLKDESLIKNQIYLTKYNFDLFSNFTFFLKDDFNGDQIRQRESRILLGYTNAYERQDSFLGKKWNTEIGFQFRHDLSQDNELSHTVDKTTLLDRLAYGDIKESNIGVYLNETVRITSRFTMNAGIRFDHFEFGYTDQLHNLPFQHAIDNILSPKLNAYYQLTDHLQLSGNIGYGFHSNDTRVVIAQESFETLPRAMGMDIGLLWKAGKNLILSAAAWRLGMDQEFVYVGDEAVVEPSGRTLRMGTEFSGRMAITDWLFADIDVNYTLARAVDEAEGQDYIPLAPKLSSIGGLTVKTGQHWSGSLRYRALGDRAANETNTVIALGYTVFDLLLQYRMKQYEFGLRIDNLFNTKWRETQFETESRLKDEIEPVSEIHFTPGTPFSLRAFVAYKF